jgi:hypothetical protein
MPRQPLARDFRFEAAAQVQFLPRCPSCGHKHPRAYNPPLTTDFCPKCFSPAAPAGEPIDVPAVATDRRIQLGKLLLRICAFLRNLAERK